MMLKKGYDVLLSCGVVEMWYQYLRHNDFSDGDEICFYFMPNKNMGAGNKKIGDLG